MLVLGQNRRRSRKARLQSRGPRRLPDAGPGVRSIAGSRNTRADLTNAAGDVANAPRSLGAEDIVLECQPTERSATTSGQRPMASQIAVRRSPSVRARPRARRDAPDEDRGSTDRAAIQSGTTRHDRPAPEQTMGAAPFQSGGCKASRASVYRWRAPDGRWRDTGLASTAARARTTTDDEVVPKNLRGPDAGEDHSRTRHIGVLITRTTDAGPVG
jgi:hypothetical protein